MASQFTSTYSVLAALRKFLKNYDDRQFYIYSGHREFGCLLVKNEGNSRRFLFKPWDTVSSIGQTKVEKFVEYQPRFKGHPINAYVFIGRSFGKSLHRLAGTRSQITLVEVDFSQSHINLFGSMHLDRVLLDALLLFTESIDFEIVHDSEEVLKNGALESSSPSKEEDGEKGQASRPRVFISYKWQDEARDGWVKQFCTDLREQYGIDALLDRFEIDYGESISEYMARKINYECDAVLFVITPAAVEAVDRADTGGVRFEMQLAAARRREDPGFRIIGVYREGGDNVSYLRDHLYADFRVDNRYAENLRSLADSLWRQQKKPPLALQVDGRTGVEEIEGSEPKENEVESRTISQVSSSQNAQEFPYFFERQKLGAKPLNDLYQFIVQIAMKHGMSLKPSVVWQDRETLKSRDLNRMLDDVEAIYNYVGKSPPKWSFNRFQDRQVLKHSQLNEIIDSIKCL